MSVRVASSPGCAHFPRTVSDLHLQVTLLLLLLPLLLFLLLFHLLFLLFLYFLLLLLLSPLLMLLLLLFLHILLLCTCPPSGAEELLRRSWWVLGEDSGAGAAPLVCPAGGRLGGPVRGTWDLTEGPTDYTGSRLSRITFQY